MPPVDFGKIEPRRLEFDDDFSDFNCDVEDDLGCNDFIHKENEAKQYQKGLHGITYIFRYEGMVVGYVTLAMSSILAQRLDKKDRGIVHLNFYPCLLIGRLAVANEIRHQGIGKYLANWSTGIALEMSERIGCRYVALETTESKTSFYSRCSFERGAILEADRHVWMYKKIATQ